MYTYEDFMAIDTAYELTDACEEIGIDCKYDRDYICDTYYLQETLRNLIEGYAWEDIADVVRYLSDGSDSDEYYNYDRWETITADDIDTAKEEALDEMHSKEIYLEGDPRTPDVSEDIDFDIVYGYERGNNDGEGFSIANFNIILGGKTE